MPIHRICSGVLQGDESMKMQINEFAKLTGVSVRTLHYYDSIGLLKPSCVDSGNGYRFYDENSLERMQEIMFYRELDFSLKTISELVSSPNYDKAAALRKQRHLLALKKQRLEKLLCALDKAAEGEDVMDFKAFDNSDYESACKEYAAEVKEKWGDTAAYEESGKKTSSYSKEKWNEVSSAMDEILAQFAQCKKSGAKPADNEAQALVEKWRNFITENHYNCTKEILAGLGEMYSCDERFAANINRHGDGTAEFMTCAIREYCK